MSEVKCVWAISAIVGDDEQKTVFVGTMEQMLLFALHHYSRSDINPLGLSVKNLNMIMVQTVKDDEGWILEENM